MAFPEVLKSALAEVADEVVIECLDCLGCGEFYAEPAAGSVAELTDQIRAQLAHRQSAASSPSGSKLILLGISMGGMIAMDWAQRFPQEVDGVILINSSTGDQPLFRRLRWQCWPRALIALLVGTAKRESMFLKIVSNNKKDYARNLRIWLDIQTRRPVSAKNIIRLLRAASTFNQPARAPSKGLVLASRQDRMVNPRCSMSLADTFCWPLHLHPNAGHDLTLDDPNWAAEKIAAWYGANTEDL